MASHTCWSLAMTYVPILGRYWIASAIWLAWTRSLAARCKSLFPLKTCILRQKCSPTHYEKEPFQRFGNFMCQNIHAAIQAAPTHRANFYASENALFSLSRYAEKAFSQPGIFMCQKHFSLAPSRLALQAGSQQSKENIFVGKPQFNATDDSPRRSLPI